MTAQLRLVVFDVDGTLVDSQAEIIGAMTDAFASLELPRPDRASVLEIVGLSLPHAMARLMPEADLRTRDRLVEAYRAAYAARRIASGDSHSPLFAGAREAIETLSAAPETLLGIATGKSRRGLDHLLDLHGLRHHFVTCQVADDHPSKPNPAMLTQALFETGVEADAAVMIGDTVHDLQMARAAGVPFVGVTWGYHTAGRLAAADILIDSFDALPMALERLCRAAA